MKGRRVVVYMRHGSTRRPVLSVDWKDDHQVVVRLRQPQWGSHLTLHHRENEPILLTLSMKNKPPSGHDAARVEAARRLGYAKPERHRNYISQQELGAIFDDIPLVGWGVDLATVTDKRKYGTRPYIEITAPSERCLVNVHLASPGSLIDSDEPHVATPLGDLYFRFERQ